jgi:hemolysin activation/secretion protein
MSKNELYRIGGNALLRGFKERRFYASLYSVASLELRYLLGKNSNVHLFYDGGYYKNLLNEKVKDDFPYGFGVGAHLDTGQGIISLSYALGKAMGEPIELKNAKVHIGYINKF